MGRSRGGLTTKIHAVVDACGLPIRLKLTEGQAHDGRSAQDMLGTVGCGDVLIADRAYDSNALRDTLAARGARANVRPMSRRLKPPRFNKRLYRKRNLVERFFNKLKAFSRRRNPIRQARRQLPRIRPTRFHSNLDAL